MDHWAPEAIKNFQNYIFPLSAILFDFQCQRIGYSVMIAPLTFMRANLIFSGKTSLAANKTDHFHYMQFLSQNCLFFNILHCPSLGHPLRGLYVHSHNWFICFWCNMSHCSFHIYNESRISYSASVTYQFCNADYSYLSTPHVPPRQAVV